MLSISHSINSSARIPAIPLSSIPAVNVATVPQRSPLRYPGGKTWLVPHIRAWLGNQDAQPEVIVEPFAGGGIVSLTAVMEGLAQRCVMAEIDREVAAFWKAALEHSDALIAEIRQFSPTRRQIEEIAEQSPTGVLERGFRALALNRTRRGGILAAGASLSRSGENGKGLASRWYPETLAKRLYAIAEYAGQIEFHETDGMELLEGMVSSYVKGETVVFADPPYTAGGKRAGSRLYNHNVIDHQRLFALLADSEVNFLMTYDESPEIVALVAKHRFSVVRVIMKNTHHAHLSELVITPQPVFIR